MHGLVALHRAKKIKERRARERYVTGVKLCVFCITVIDHHHSLGDEV